MSQISEFDAQLRSELLARHAGNLGWCAACGEPVLLTEDSMCIEGRVAHVDCRGGAVRRAGDRVAGPVGARVPRARIALSCTLRRRIGSPIVAETIELGPDGMRVTTPRPLATDETVNFELPNLPMRVGGLARVLRQQRPHVYALRFERLPEAMYRCLHALVTRAGHPDLE
ncbi:MAG TPA: PilZ domain-containing protein [Solirubrobacteraceae bacterium]|nr:PilZ domain-containing protein [Solirubrobacteraceae bacterium]